MRLTRMNRSCIVGTACCAAVAFAPGRGLVAGAPWHAADQPERQQALEIVPVAYPTFVGNDLYVSGHESLRRVCNVLPGS